MKILVIPTTDWTRNPNPNRLNFVFDRLTVMGHHVDVLHFNLGIFSDCKPRETKCNLIEVDGIKLHSQVMYYLVNAPLIYKTMKNAVATNNYDVILSANILPAFIANFMGIPVIHDYLDHWEESASSCYPDGSKMGDIVRWGVHKITKYNLAKATHIITVTDELRWLIHDFLVFSGKLDGVRLPQVMVPYPDKVSVIPNGVDTKLLRPINKIDAKEDLGIGNSFVVGYVGSLESWVDFEGLFECAPDCRTSRGHITILVVGSALYGAYDQYLHVMASKMLKNINVVFTGRIPYDELYKYISAMDVGLNPLKSMPKNRYALGGKIFNYLACGVPVLSSDGESISNFASKHPGTVYFKRGRDYISRSIDIVQEEKRYGDAKSLSDYRIRVAKQFDWDVIALSYEGVIEEVVKNVERTAIWYSDD